MMNIAKNMLIDEYYSVYPLFFNILHQKVSDLNLYYNHLTNSKSYLKNVITKLNDEIEDIDLYMDTILIPNIHKNDLFGIGYIFMEIIYKNFKNRIQKR